FKNTGLAINQECYPPIMDHLINSLELDASGCLKTNLNYSITLKDDVPNSCFLNGLCESSHGMGDAGSFSLLALRSEVIVKSLMDTLEEITLKCVTYE
ncbi:MAG: ornithine monooxygenase, partial [Sphingobacteriales bacterium]